MLTSHGRVALPAAPKARPRRQESGRYQGETHGARHPTVVCRHAAGVAVEYESPVTRDTHPYPPVVLRDQPARLCSGTLRALRCTPHHILPGFSVLHPRAQISETERRITALVCGFTPRSYPRCYKRKCKRNIVEPTSRKEIRFLRSRHLQNGEADSQERRRSDYEAV
jgi:hypothetical protein